MDALSTILLVILYPLLVLARVVNALRGRDRLRLRRPPATASCWIERSREADNASYFSEASRAEGYPWSSAAQPIARALRMLSRLYAPAGEQTEETFTPAVDGHQDIPDEVYTLWLNVHC